MGRKGRGDEVACLPDHLSLEPISATAVDRAAWFGREMGAAGRIELRGGDPRRGMAGTEIRLADPVAAP